MEAVAVNQLFGLHLIFTNRYNRLLSPTLYRTQLL